LIEALENYSAHHPESMYELLYEWPWQKFEAFFDAFAKRQIIDGLEARRNAIIAGLYGNGNMENEALKKSLDEIENNFQHAIEVIYGEEEDSDLDQEIKDSPFFSAMKVPTIDEETSMHLDQLAEKAGVYDVEQDDE
jgi:hypothetical protein